MNTQSYTQEQHKVDNEHPLAQVPYLQLSHTDEKTIPDDAACFALWDKYAMLDNVRAHSLMVADFATSMAQKAQEKGHNICVASVRASALLHDLAKSYTIAHGGSHAQIGASWVVWETGNRQLAQGVLMHVCWPWTLPDNMCTLPFFVIYADKRIMHDACVSLDQRFNDLLVRYGDIEKHRIGIHQSYLQGKSIERALSAQLELELDAYTLDSGRLVQRT